MAATGFSPARDTTVWMLIWTWCSISPQKVDTALYIRHVTPHVMPRDVRILLPVWHIEHKSLLISDAAQQKKHARESGPESNRGRVVVLDVWAPCQIIMTEQAHCFC